MSRISSTVALPTLSILLFASAAFGQNTTFNQAIVLTVGQTFHESTVDQTNTERWFQLPVLPGRSYCAEAVTGRTQDFPGDPDIVIYSSDATTVITSNSDIDTIPALASHEPGGYSNARACWIPPINEFSGEYLKVTSHIPGFSSTFAVRVVETTLFSNWFFTGGDYSAYTLLRNTTNVSVPYTINWRNALGSILSTVTGTLVANGSTFVNARDQAAALAAGSGTVEIAHSGSMDAIVATTTVLSATTGLSFDTVFIKRTAW